MIATRFGKAQLLRERGVQRVRVLHLRQVDRDDPVCVFIIHSAAIFPEKRPSLISRGIVCLGFPKRILKFVFLVHHGPKMHLDLMKNFIQQVLRVFVTPRSILTPRFITVKSVYAKRKSKR